MNGIMLIGCIVVYLVMHSKGEIKRIERERDCELYHEKRRNKLKNKRTTSKKVY